MSKGSTPRPKSVSEQEFKTRWEDTFGRSPMCPKCGTCSSRIKVAKDGTRWNELWCKCFEKGWDKCGNA